MKRLLFMILFCTSIVSAQQHTFPAEDTNNTFTGTNTFKNSVFTSLVQYTVATLPAPTGNGTFPYEIVQVIDGVSTSDCSTGSGNLIALCVNNGSAWVALGGSGGGGSILPSNNIFTGTNDFTNTVAFGAVPFFDITSSLYGGRSVDPAPSSTGSCNGTTAYHITGSIPAFINGDGVLEFNCGATQTAGSAPAAPTVVSGITSTMTQQDAVIVPLTGSTSWWYKLVGMDKYGGLTAPGTVTHITNGLATLGPQTPLSVTSASLSGTVLTLTLPATNNLAAGILIHYRGSTPSYSLNGWYTITSVSGGGETIVASNLHTGSNSSSPVTATGGSLYYFAAHQLTWTAGSENQMAICRSTDGTNYTLIGYSYVNNAASYFSSQTFDDFGATMTTAPHVWLPYMTNSICTASSATNDYLETTIVSGGGTANLITANASTQTASGQSIYQSNTPALLAAATAARSSLFGKVYIPPAPGLFHLNGYADLTALGPGLTIVDDGLLSIDATIASRAYWRGEPSGSLNNFQPFSTTPVYCNAWPCFYDPDEVPHMEFLAVNATGNAANVFQFDGAAGDEGGHLFGINVSTGETSADMMGTCFVVRAGPFSFTWDYITCDTGPGNTSATFDESWTAGIYFSPSANTPYNPDAYIMSNFWGSGRGVFYALMFGGPGEISFNNYYVQGGQLPILTFQSTTWLGFPSVARSGVNLNCSNLTNDTSTQGTLAFLGDTNVFLNCSQLLGGGIASPALITGDEVGGTAIQSANLFDVIPPPNTVFTNAQPTFPTPTNPGDLAYYNGYFWTNFAGNTSGSRLLQESSAGVPSWFSLASPGTIGGTTPGIGNFSQVNLPESTAPSGVSATDVLYGISASHQIGVKLNNGSQLYLPNTDGSGVGGHCAEFTSAYEIVDNGGACGSGGTGTVTTVNMENITTATQNWATCATATASTTPDITCTLANSPSHKYFGNATGGSAAPDYSTIVEGDLPATTVFTDTANTFGAHLNSFAAATLKIPASAGFTSSAVSNFGWNTTTNNIQFWNGSNLIAALWASTPTNAQCVTAGVSGSTITLVPGACTSGVTLQTNTVNNSSQSTLNLVSSSAGANSITQTNTSGGIVQSTIQNSAGGGNAVLDCTLTGTAQGQTLTFDATPKCVNAFSGTVPNAQTGTTYAIASSDRSGLIICDETSAALAISLASAASFGSNFGFAVVNQGTYPCTITPATSTINGTTTWTFLPGQQGNIVSDNTNYFATRSGYGSGTTGTITGTGLTATCDSGTATIQGVTAGMPVSVSSTTGADVGGAFNLRASVTGSNTVTVYVCGTGTPSSLAYNVRVSQ